MSEQDLIGIQGENAIYNYLVEHNYSVRDVSHDPAYWPVDIDFIVSKNGVSQSIEVKNCRNISKTGNLFVEHTQDIDRNEPGWIKVSEADQLYYRDDINQVCYVIDMADLRDYIQTRRGELRERRAFPNAVGKVAVGYLVQIQDLSLYYPVRTINA